MQSTDIKHTLSCLESASLFTLNHLIGIYDKICTIQYFVCFLFLPTCEGVYSEILHVHIKCNTFGWQPMNSQHRNLRVAKELLDAVYGWFVFECMDERLWGIVCVFQEDWNNPSEIVCEGWHLDHCLGGSGLGISVPTIGHIQFSPQL